MDLKKIIEKYDISLENMYNMNENEFSIEEIETSKYIINANIRQKFQKAKLERQE